MPLYQVDDSLRGKTIDKDEFLNGIKLVNLPTDTYDPEYFCLVDDSAGGGAELRIFSVHIATSTARPGHVFLTGANIPYGNLTVKSIPAGSLWELEYGPEVVAEKPTVVDVPYLSGTPTEGEILTVTLGNWTGEPTSYAAAWMRDGSEITTATGDSYTLVTADVGASITVVVTATNAVGSTTAPPSNAVGPVQAAAKTRR
jgi:hypothetical protein